MNKLYLLTQDEVCSYDTYDSCVVVAETEEEARWIRPDYGTWEKPSYSPSWPTKVENVEVKFIGYAATDASLKAGDLILSSFNAG